MGRYYFDKKDEADDCRKISVFRLKEWRYFDKGSSGVITWTWHPSGQQSSVSVQVVLSEHDQYLRIHYTQTEQYDKKTKYDYNIPLVTTPCHIGGKRYWFICPWYKNGVYCGRRVGTLYHGGSYFACRHCYNLSYASRNENRRFYMHPWGKMMDLERKIEDFGPKVTTKFYRGKPTKKYRKLLRLERQCYGSDTMSGLAEMNAKLEQLLKR